MYSSEFAVSSREMYMFNACILILMLVGFIVVRSTADNARIMHSEMHDPLTGLPNQARLINALNKLSDTDNKNGFLLLIDLAQLKAINNSMGKEAGDRVLAAYAQRLKYLFAKPVRLARINGGTFAVFLPDLVNAEAAQLLAKELQKAVAIPVRVNGKPLFLSLEMGGCFVKDAQQGANQLLQRGELALIEARDCNTKKLQIFSRRLAEKVHQRSMLATDLHEALENDSLEPFYQPLIASDGKSVVGFEALARWKHPSEGYIAPGSFVPVAEQLNLTGRLGRQIMYKACRDIKHLPGMKVSVNVSPNDLFQADFIVTVQSVLMATGLEPERLELEITESLFINESEKVKERLEDLRLLGVSVALDDFGAGYSGLSYLNKFKVDRIKIDASFVKNLADSENSRAMIATIIQMVRTYDMAITVEGVETEEQYGFLSKYRGLTYQGYYFDKPMQLSDLLDSKFVADLNYQRFEQDQEFEKKKSAA